MCGEKVVAAQYLSRFNDSFYGQWLMLNVPSSDPKSFVDEAMLKRVPSQYRHMAMAITCRAQLAQRIWYCGDALQMELQVEGHTSKHAETLITMCHANAKLIREYKKHSCTGMVPAYSWHAPGKRIPNVDVFFGEMGRDSSTGR